MTFLKKHVEAALRKHPRLFALASRAYYRLDRSFRSLSPGAPDAIRQALVETKEHLVGEDGDYYEFGLFRGYTFWFAQNACRELGIAKMHFYGFDSFGGLPPIEGVDLTNNQFFEGQFESSEEEVVRNLSKRGVDWSRTTLVEGFFSDSLTEELKRRHAFRQVSIAFIDCDLYSSTREVLVWLNGLLTDGSIILFDDWYSFGPSPELGQQRAFREFMRAHPEYVAEPLLEFADHGKGFVLRR
jgi:hypothetical protein